MKHLHEPWWVFRFGETYSVTIWRGKRGQERLFVWQDAEYKIYDEAQKEADCLNIYLHQLIRDYAWWLEQYRLSLS